MTDYWKDVTALQCRICGQLVSYNVDDINEHEAQHK
jgi:hypothetical protein